MLAILSTPGWLPNLETPSTVVRFSESYAIEIATAVEFPATSERFTSTGGVRKLGMIQKIRFASGFGPLFFAASLS